MNIYLIKRTDRWGYDNYDSVVVAAESAEEAVKINPDIEGWDCEAGFSSWAASPDLVQATLLGTAAPDTESGIILASFNGG